MTDKKPKTNDVPEPIDDAKLDDASGGIIAVLIGRQAPPAVDPTNPNKIAPIKAGDGSV